MQVVTKKSQLPKIRSDMKALFPLQRSSRLQPDFRSLWLRCPFRRETYMWYQCDTRSSTMSPRKSQLQAGQSQARMASMTASEARSQTMSRTAPNRLHWLNLRAARPSSSSRPSLVANRKAVSRGWVRQTGKMARSAANLRQPMMLGINRNTMISYFIQLNNSIKVNQYPVKLFITHTWIDISLKYLSTNPGRALPIIALHRPIHFLTSSSPISFQYLRQACNSCSIRLFYRIYSLSRRGMNSQQALKPLRRGRLGLFRSKSYIQCISRGARQRLTNQFFQLGDENLNQGETIQQRIPLSIGHSLLLIRRQKSPRFRFLGPTTGSHGNSTTWGSLLFAVLAASSSTSRLLMQAWHLGRTLSLMYCSITFPFLSYFLTTSSRSITLVSLTLSIVFTGLRSASILVSMLRVITISMNLLIFYSSSGPSMVSSASSGASRLITSFFFFFFYKLKCIFSYTPVIL